MLNDSEMTLPQSDTVASAIQFQSVSTLCYSNPLLSFHARLLSNELTVLHGSTMCIFQKKIFLFCTLFSISANSPVKRKLESNSSQEQ